ncbi:undecaprenyl-phosphate glucose phosphotransferase [Winogradskyella sp.]|uniref:undecaprenyl-phosphate glucose phosphotransferase n=1 Tax=Winogradskyella sp. TaxID=1883156 RepID=UPI0025EF450F|nr:undecaprenyl-phosphate glucose phosphotransferase [Winogradskyella sp.]
MTCCSIYLLQSNFDDTIYFTIFWITLSIVFSFYNVYRYTKITEIISIITRQIIVYVLLVISYIYFDRIDIQNSVLLKFSFVLLVVFISWRILIYLLLREYRIITGSNFRKVIIVGDDSSTERLKGFFENELEYGYRLSGVFDKKRKDEKENVSKIFNFIKKEEIDEVYCSLKKLSSSEIKKFIDFCDYNVVSLKFIPSQEDIYSKNLRLNYYDITPVLSLRQIPLDDQLNALTKRVFDIVFSLVIICFILSWLIPILGILIMLESKGPIFFRQDRPGIKEKGFGCYKFRSMTLNTDTELSATKGDSRVTKIGKFIRRTSIDELPQFFNVLFGSMSVVGPRPHLWRQNEIYATKISKYMVRHLVKPGVTGLAQVKGYRGEIQTHQDIVNRTKYDVFYIENWSMLLDLNIIIGTILNVFRGDEKAY